MNAPPENFDVDRTAVPFEFALAIGLAMLTVGLGGYLAGCAIAKWGTIGSVSLWAAGGIAGWLAAQFLSPNRQVGYLLAASVVIAFLVAEVCWIHWRIVGGDTWIDAIRLLPA